jgi:hypothetical protein
MLHRSDRTWKNVEKEANEVRKMASPDFGIRAASPTMREL